MPKVTKEVMQSLFDAHVYTPRHQQRCPKNYARCLPMIYAAMGLSLVELKEKVTQAYNEMECTCK